ncbi:MAG: hypothetical protein JWL59_3094 [Chthoniobacteraceae bacterium]|nr:hypothetical protein [Chthoniobacteraceae bacterium]
MQIRIKQLVASLLLGVLLDSFTCADSLAPEVAPRAAKYEADTKAIDAARATAVARVQQDYLSYLAAADKAASASGKPEELALVLKAREAITSPTSDASLPAIAPKAFQKRHADYFGALAAVDREFAPRYQQTNGTFLRDLAAIESRLPTNSPAHEQIAEIKAKLVESSGKGGLSGIGEIAGKWKLTYASGAVGSVEFFPNYTWKHPKDTSPTKKWKVEDDKLVMEFPDGGREWFILPVNPKGTKGATGRGVKFDAVRQTR